VGDDHHPVVVYHNTAPEDPTASATRVFDPTTPDQIHPAQARIQRTTASNEAASNRSRKCSFVPERQSDKDSFLRPRVITQRKFSEAGSTSLHAR
jgi:hypothetical protein